MNALESGSDEVRIVKDLCTRQHDQDVLDCREFWLAHDDYVIRANKVVNRPFFYPVYQWGDFYSFSPLPLLIRKGTVDVDPKVMKELRGNRGDVNRPDAFLDREIVRVGAPPELNPLIRNRSEFAGAMAKAMQDDVDEVEMRNPGKTNIILCGGKDSLNLLLLKWSNPVRVYSAEPNFPLVRDFVENNGLKFEVIRLNDRDEQALRMREIAEACGLVDMRHWRWTADLRRIALDLDRSAVFWKGQFADAILTDKWRSYTSSYSKVVNYTKKIYRELARHTPPAIRRPIDEVTLRDFVRSIWLRGAVMQGAHMGFLRSICDCLFVSGYHGQKTASVWLSGDYPAITGPDIRPEIGRVLLGRDVLYPASNPSPSPSQFRRNFRDLDEIMAAMRAFGVSVAASP